MTKIQKNDFIELEYVGKTKDLDELFDSTKPEDGKKLNMKEPEKLKPVVICVGNSMTIRGLDEDLIGKEINKDYEVEIQPEKGFGKRDPKAVRMIPTKAFLEQRINPQKGMQLSLDGNVVKIISVSGGRVLTDFNNPLAGKTLKYNYKILRKLEDEKEKVNSLQDFFFRKQFDFNINKEKKELIFKVDEQMAKFVEIMSRPFKEMLDLDVKFEVLKEEKKEKNN